MSLRDNPFVQARVLLLTTRKAGFQGAVGEKVAGNLLATIPVAEDAQAGDVVRITQDMLDRTILKDMDGYKNKLRGWIEKRSVDIGLPGVNLIPQNRMSEVEKKLAGAKEWWKGRSKDFTIKYNGLIEDFARKYPTLYDPKRYPALSQLDSRFFFSWKWLTIDVPNGNVRGLSAEEIEAEKNRFLEELRQMEIQVLNKVSEALKERLSEAVGKYDMNGGLNKSALKNVGVFLEGTYKGLYDGFLFDEKLKCLIEEEITPFVSGINREKLADSPVYQAEIANMAERLGDKLSAVTEEAKKDCLRAIDF